MNGGASVRIAGYAAVFDRIDRGGDIIRPGAFAASLRRRGPRDVPLLWQHRPDMVIGTVDTLAEDARGLRVIARIDPARAAQIPALGRVATGAAGQGLSFGYRVVAARGEKPRVLNVLDLVEVSLVAVPMQPLARVHAVSV